MIYTENESGGGVVVALLAWIAAIVLFTDSGLGPWMARNWLLVPLILAGYVAVGIGWSLFQWKSYTDNWLSYDYNKSRTLDQKKAALDPTNHKNRIVSWMMGWPFSMTWKVLRWPREFFVFIYNRLLDRLRAMSEAAIRKGG